VAAVSAGGYLGFLAGPPTIGGISEVAGLRVGLLLLVVLCCVVTFLSSAVRVPSPARR
jgi:MFS family permease